MTFKKEADFEEELIHLLTSVSGWKKDTCGWGNSDGAYESVLRYPDEEDLLKNWANILYNNNKSRDRLMICTLFPGHPGGRVFLCAIVMSLN